MKKYFPLKYLSLTVILLLSASFVVSAQERPAAQDAAQQFDATQPENTRPNLMRELGLSQEQIQQIRRMNAERKPLMNQAQRRLRMANRALDQAIYSDSVNEEDVQVRLKEFQAAQAEMVRLRFTNELAVRKILTREQLVRFRELRQNFAERRRQNMQNNPAGRQLRLRNRQLRPNMPN